MSLERIVRTGLFDSVEIGVGFAARDFWKFLRFEPMVALSLGIRNQRSHAQLIDQKIIGRLQKMNDE
jgi:hypothetical protein